MIFELIIITVILPWVLRKSMLSSSTIVVLFTILVFCSVLYVTTLNYLSYIKIRAKKIIYHTVISIIFFTLCLFSVIYFYVKG